MNQEDNMMKGKKTKNIYEQFPVDVSFCKTSNLGNPAYLEVFGNKCVRDIVKGST